MKLLEKRTRNMKKNKIKRGVMMKMIFSMLLLLGSISIFAAPTVTDVVAKQRYPWNGLVDITCKVTGIEDSIIEDSISYKFIVNAVRPDEGITNKVSQFWVLQDGTKQSGYDITSNDDYHILLDAKAELGSVYCTNMIVCVTLKCDKVQLWEGGPYWATTNIGAEKPEDYGYYFWWGDTVGYKYENNKWVASDGSNSNFWFTSHGTPTYNKSISTLRSEGWITPDWELTPEHNAANVQWGNGWRMPTEDELSILHNNCDWTLMTMNGVNGYIVRGRDAFASNSIFLPAAGYGSGPSLYSVGWGGYYCSSTPNSDYCNFALCIYSYLGRHYTSGGYYDRYYGQTIRPVFVLTK